MWACPRCKAPLWTKEVSWHCTPCGSVFDTLEGIPDFRVSSPTWIDFEEDRRQAKELVEAVPGDDVEAAVRFVFARKKGWSARKVERRVRQVLDSPERLRAELAGWLEPFGHGADPLLDLGCGSGMLLAAAIAQGRRVVGIDVSLFWLVVARRMVRAAGGEPLLAAGLAEYLPLASGSIGSVAVLDVIEHVADPAPMLRELNRVLRPTGTIALATPNRFSLAAEPHVGVGGVGWLPRRWQDPYVRLRTGLPYAYCRLLSARELRRLFLRHTSISIRIEPAPVPATELAAFPRWRAALGRVYNGLLRWRPAAWMLLRVGPFMHVIGRRR